MKNNNTRFIIYGSGGIGMLLGAGLYKAGHQVLLVGRPGNIDAITANGLKIITANEEETLQLHATCDYRSIVAGESDIILLCVKAHQTEQAVRELQEIFPSETPIVSIQNGVHNEEIIAKSFDTIISSVVIIFGMNLESGVVDSGGWKDPYGYLELGQYGCEKADTPLVKELASMLDNSGFVAICNRDIRKAQWGKLLLNLGNAVHAITDVRISDDFFNQILTESEAALTAASIEYEGHDELLQRFTRFTQRPFEFTLSGNRPYLGSAWQSLKLRKGHIEVDHFNGEICKIAEQYHIQVPLNKLLLETSLEMAANRELPGKFSEEELLSQIKTPKTGVNK